MITKRILFSLQIPNTKYETNVYLQLVECKTNNESPARKSWEIRIISGPKGDEQSSGRYDKYELAKASFLARISDML